MKTTKIIYWISTGLLTALMLMSAGLYFFNYDQMSASFVNLGFPTYLIYPLAIAKLLGLVAILTRRSTALAEWAYAGFFFNLLLAVSAHLHAGDNEFQLALGGLVFVVVSYFSQKRLAK